MNNPEYEKKFTIKSDGQEELLTIQLFDIDFTFRKAERSANWPEEWDLTSFESKIISEKDGVESEVKDITRKEGLIGHFLSESDILEVMIPIWRERAEEV